MQEGKKLSVPEWEEFDEVEEGGDAEANEEGEVPEMFEDEGGGEGETDSQEEY